MIVLVHGAISDYSLCVIILQFLICSERSAVRAVVSHNLAIARSVGREEGVIIKLKDDVISVAHLAIHEISVCLNGSGT